MRNLSHASRLVVAGAIASAIAAGAGIIAFTGESSLKLSSALLVAAIAVALIGYAYADNRGLGWGALTLVAATLPLFGVLYAIGAVIMSHLGPAIAGAGLIGVSVVFASLTIGLSARGQRDAGAHVRLGGSARRGAPVAPSER